MIPSDKCDGDYVDLIDPFILGSTNTPVNTRQGSVLLGSNGGCDGIGVEFWRYPKSRSPYKDFRSDAGTYGIAASIAT